MERLLAAIHEEFRGEIRRDEPMSSHTIWRVGGPAQLFLIPVDASDLQAVLAVLERFRAPWMILGHGTNLLVRDGGITGAVISLERFDSIEMKILGRIQVGAGVALAELIRLSVKSGLKGLEELSGIPGTVGGALIMNAGAGETEIGARVESLTMVGTDGEKTIDQESAGFKYRRSDLPGQGVLVSATLKLTNAESDDLQRLCREKLERRSKEHNVGGPRAGWVFRNPPEQDAWQLIEAAGLSGERSGYAEISTTCCNHIVNLGQATAEDVLNLIDITKRRVIEHSGIDLELDVNVVGREVAQ